jgi:hypothetical protein
MYSKCLIGSKCGIESKCRIGSNPAFSALIIPFKLSHPRPFRSCRPLYPPFLSARPAQSPISRPCSHSLPLINPRTQTVSNDQGHRGRACNRLCTISFGPPRRVDVCDNCGRRCRSRLEHSETQMRGGIAVSIACLEPTQHTRLEPHSMQKRF